MKKHSSFVLLYLINWKKISRKCHVYQKNEKQN